LYLNPLSGALYRGFALHLLSEYDKIKEIVNICKAMTVQSNFGLFLKKVCGMCRRNLVAKDKQEEMREMRFIGFYDYTVVLTYLSLISSVLGMTRAIHGDYKSAIFCLALSGICDAFDGRIARTKKNRTEDERNFGVQLDSLCDVICFGLFPAMICYLLGVRGTLGVALVLFYCLCAVIRLGFFNVLEAKRQNEESGTLKTYRGLPVTSIAFILPFAFWLQFVLPELVFMVLLHVVLLVVGFLFVLDFPLRKPGLKTIITLSLILVFTVGIILGYTRFRVPAQTEESNPIVEEIFEEMIEDGSDDQTP